MSRRSLAIQAKLSVFRLISLSEVSVKLLFQLAFKLPSSKLTHILVEQFVDVEIGSFLSEKILIDEREHLTTRIDLVGQTDCLLLGSFFAVFSSEFLQKIKDYFMFT